MTHTNPTSTELREAIRVFINASDRIQMEYKIVVAFHPDIFSDGGKHAKSMLEEWNEALGSLAEAEAALAPQPSKEAGEMATPKKYCSDCGHLWAFHDETEGCLHHDDTHPEFTQCKCSMPHPPPTAALASASANEGTHRPLAERIAGEIATMWDESCSCPSKDFNRHEWIRQVVQAQLDAEDILMARTVAPAGDGALTGLQVATALYVTIRDYGDGGAEALEKRGMKPEEWYQKLADALNERRAALSTSRPSSAEPRDKVRELVPRWRHFAANSGGNWSDAITRCADELERVLASSAEPQRDGSA